MINPPCEAARKLLKSLTVLVLVYCVVLPMFAVNSSAQRKTSRSRVHDSTPTTDTKGKEISVEAQLQIKALLDEKESRTPAQQKIDSQLLYAAKQRRGDHLFVLLPDFKPSVEADDLGMVTVDIMAEVSDKLLSQLRAIGADVLRTEPVYQTLRASVSLDRLEEIASLPEVRFIRPEQLASGEAKNPGLEKSLPSRGVSAAISQRRSDVNPRIEQITSELAELGIVGNTSTNLLPNGYARIGSASSEADITMGTYSARGVYNATGAGIKIGVLSGGVVNLGSSQALGDLGPVTVLPGQTGTGDRGTAMLEIIHDIAPGAELYFATGNPTITQFAQNIRDLRTAGCDIIVDDVSYFNESPFQEGQTFATDTNGGVVNQAVADVTASGAMYFSGAAGNYGNSNDGTSGTWEGDFVFGGTLALIPGGGQVHDFDPSAAVVPDNQITLGGNVLAPVSLTWSDPLGGAANDYDLFILNNGATTVVNSSTNTQSGTQDPYEQTSSNSTNNRVVVRQKPGAAPRYIRITTNGGRLNYSTPGAIYGHAQSANAFSVASTPAYSPFYFALPPTYYNGPYPAAHSAADKVQIFNSDGNRRVFYASNGTLYTPGNQSSTGGILRQKPDITAPDGSEVSGVGGNGSPFFQSAAAAASAAALAGLLKSGNPAATNSQIRTALTTNAIDIEGVGADRDSGFGVVLAMPSFSSLGTTGRAYLELNGTTATEFGGNGNGVIEQGETGNLLVNLKNTGVSGATGITTTLTTSTPNVSVVQGSSAYSNIGANGSGNNTTSFRFQMGALSGIDQVVNFTLTVNYTGGWNASQVFNFTVDTGRLSISSVLDATAPTTSTSFPVTATGNQTARLFRADPASTCATPHAFPGTSGAGTRNYDSYTLTNPLGVPVCATIIALTGVTTVDFLQVVAYSGSFNPASLGTNYLGDMGASPTVGYPKTMSVTVPANGTVVVTVNATTGATSIPIPYTLKVSGLKLSAATAAPVSVTGRVTVGGRAVSGVSVSMTDDSGAVRTVRTNPFGYYTFDGVTVGRTYVFQPAGKGQQFEPRTVTIQDEMELNFIQ